MKNSILILVALFTVMLGSCSKDVVEPEIETLNVWDIKTSTAKIDGNLISDNGLALEDIGFVVSKNSKPTLENKEFYTRGVAAVGKYTYTVTNLLKNTTYFVRAYVTTESGECFYGNDLEFTTMD